MKYEDFKKILEHITFDASLSIEKRIELALAAYEEAENEETGSEIESDEQQAGKLRDESLGHRILFARCLIDMIDREGAAEERAPDMLQLYGILAEALAEKEDYRPLREIAYRVREIIRQDDMPWTDIEEAMPAILDALNETVFNHADYELHLHYLRRAMMAGCLGPDLKGRARRLLKLRVLLEDTSWHDHYFSRELEHAIAALFTPDELVKIIIYPRIGHLRQDPVEFTRRWEDIYYDVEQRLEERFANVHRHMGFCFMFWEAKRQLLKEEYGIDWHSPSQTNPGVMFD